MDVWLARDDISVSQTPVCFASLLTLCILRAIIMMYLYFLTMLLIGLHL